MTEHRRTEADDGEERTAAERDPEPAGGNGFASLGLDERLLHKLAEAGIASPTAVQADAIPALLAGRDGVLRSATGTGKTLAYVLPLLQRIEPSARETQAVVLAPTQELAMQIVRVAEAYGEPLGIRTVALIGGAALSRQLERMKRRPQLVIGTPGRVREVASLKKLPLHTVRTVVVDETDRVFSLGGKADVEGILRGAAHGRQTVFVSATRSDAMREAEERWLRDPWENEAEAAGSGLSPGIEHWCFVCDRRNKIDLVRRLVRHLKPAGALLFVNDIEKIGELLAKLRYEGFAVEALYGDTPGRERGEVMRKFRQGRVKLLIATDVAARGLDVPGLPLVVQFEPALDADHYVHRAGRTGRMGREGVSITLIEPRERFIAAKLGKQLGIELAEKSLREGQVVDAGQQPAGPAARGTGAAASAPKAQARTAPERKPPVAGRPGTPPERTDRRGAEGSAPARRAASPAAAQPARPAKGKAERKRDTKDKGAPRWLKEKRKQSGASETET
ncbi:DEAD/DEAH box helicase [Cohnella zeiphila]|uniref:DEAD/DEAH box helicase n=1 Tax=Cohnella zeiphila TaxID=2761120 RepID=A0A7X0SM92_9BACL|nr:DEAD/DEAH box helicase [Cohnella zeiphila]MBB6732541.1 DEAD/DEAH box helicase [Cohnella zeiphila]